MMFRMMVKITCTASGELPARKRMVPLLHSSAKESKVNCLKLKHCSDTLFRKAKCLLLLALLLLMNQARRKFSNRVPTSLLTEGVHPTHALNLLVLQHNSCTYVCLNLNIHMTGTC